jgi:hypothetical protein
MERLLVWGPWRRSLGRPVGDSATPAVAGDLCSSLIIELSISFPDVVGSRCLTLCSVQAPALNGGAFVRLVTAAGTVNRRRSRDLRSARPGHIQCTEVPTTANHDRTQ